MKVMFLDESGDHNLSVVHPDYPVFVLAGVIVDADYAKGEMAERVATFKRDFFGRQDLILHTADITRNRGAFGVLKDPGSRQRFYQGLNALLRSLQFQVVACAIRKDEHLARYGVAAVDPYMLSLHVLVERLCFEVGTGGRGGIVAEKRGEYLDGQLDLAWETLKLSGTHYVRGATVRERISDIRHRSKRENIAALQVADLVATPIGRHVIGRRTHEDFRIIEEKFRRNARGDYQGTGLVILPRPGPRPEKE